MMLAFILITTASCSSYAIRDKLLQLDAVKEAHVVFGQYDIIVKAEVPDSEALGKLVFGEIRKHDCVISTVTLTVLP